MPKKVDLKQNIVKMTCVFLPVLLVAAFAVFIGPQAVSTNPTSKQICEHKICNAGIGDRENKCYCCIECSLNNRQAGSASCPAKIDDCGPCLPGYEFMTTAGMSDRCREVVVAQPRVAAPGDVQEGKPPLQLDGPSGSRRENLPVIIGVGSVVVLALVGVAFFATRRIKSNAYTAGQRNMMSRSSSNESSAATSTEQIQLLPLHREEAQVDTAHLTSFIASELKTRNKPVEDSDDSEHTVDFYGEHTVKTGPIMHISQLPVSESLQTAVPINVEEAALNQYQTFAQPTSLNVPEENDETMVPHPTAPPPEPNPNAATTFHNSVPTTANDVQPDSGFHTNVDSDDAQSMASTYSNATTAVIGGYNSPQESPISSEEGEFQTCDETASSVGYPPSSASIATPLPEGIPLSFNLEITGTATAYFPS